ncbi:MAG: VOC family protein [Acidimicrobiales bacterium]
MSFSPYLFFAGNCREAMTRYHEIFGGEVFIMRMGDAPDTRDLPPDKADLVIHAALMLDGGMLMASDDPMTDGPITVSGIQVSVSPKTAEEANRVFDALAEGGQVTQPLIATFFSPAFGMCVDRFGTPWMVSAADPNAPS